MVLASGWKMRYNRRLSGQRGCGDLAKTYVYAAAGGMKTMMHLSWRRRVTALFFSFVVCFVLGGTFAASGLTHTTQAELDHLIPRDKWEGSGLNKLTASEQQILADEITALLGTARSTQGSIPAAKDRSQWRMLQRRMSKDDVKKLLGEPLKVSVSRFYEAWYYAGGTVTFDGKGRLDSWSEM